MILIADPRPSDYFCCPVMHCRLAPSLASLAKCCCVQRHLRLLNLRLEEGSLTSSCPGRLFYIVLRPEAAVFISPDRLKQRSQCTYQKIACPCTLFGESWFGTRYICSDLLSRIVLAITYRDSNPTGRPVALNAVWHPHSKGGHLLCRIF